MRGEKFDFAILHTSEPSELLCRGILCTDSSTIPDVCSLLLLCDTVVEDPIVNAHIYTQYHGHTLSDNHINKYTFN